MAGNEFPLTLIFICLHLLGSPKSSIFHVAHKTPGGLQNSKYIFVTNFHFEVFMYGHKKWHKIIEQTI